MQCSPTVRFIRGSGVRLHMGNGRYQTIISSAFRPVDGFAHGFSCLSILPLQYLAPGFACGLGRPKGLTRFAVTSEQSPAAHSTFRWIGGCYSHEFNVPTRQAEDDTVGYCGRSTAIKPSPRTQGSLRGRKDVPDGNRKNTEHHQDDNCNHRCLRSRS